MFKYVCLESTRIGEECRRILTGNQRPELILVLTVTFSLLCSCLWLRGILFLKGRSKETVLISMCDVVSFRISWRSFFFWRHLSLSVDILKHEGCLEIRFVSSFREIIHFCRWHRKWKEVTIRAMFLWEKSVLIIKTLNVCKMKTTKKVCCLRSNCSRVKKKNEEDYFHCWCKFSVAAS